MMKYFMILMVSIVWAMSAMAQTSVTETEARFARSQEIRAEATTAFRAGDMIKAYTTMKAALELRPGNPALLANVLYLAAETGDLNAALDFAKLYADLGLVPGGAVYQKLKEKLNENPAYQAAWAKLQAHFTTNQMAVGHARTLAEVPTAHRLVEGIAPRPDGEFYLSTVVSGTLLEVQPNGRISVLVDGADHAAGSFFGIAYSNLEHAVYATYGQVDQTPNIPKGEGLTGVMRFDPKTGNVTGDWSLAGSTQNQQIADIAISPAGVVYVTEAQSGALYQVDGDHLKKIKFDVDFMSPQGVVVDDDGLLLMADYGRGLWQLNPVQATAKLLPVPSNHTLIGIDGLFSHKGRLFAIQNGVNPQRIVEIIRDPSRTMIIEVRTLAQSLPEFDEPTLGISTPEGIVFVASSQWPKYGAGGVTDPANDVQPTRILLLED